MARNEFIIGNDASLDRHFKPIFIGQDISPIEVSENAFKINGDVNIEGDITARGSLFGDKFVARDMDIKGGQFKVFESGSTTNFLQFYFGGGSAALLHGANDLTISAGADCNFVVEGNDIMWTGSDGNIAVWTLSSTGIEMKGYDTANRSYTFAPTGTGDMIFKSDGLVIQDNGDVDTPASGYGTLYVNSDVLYFKTDGGTATNLLSGGGASALDDLSDVTYSSGDLTISSLDKVVLSNDLLFDSSADLITHDTTKTATYAGTNFDIAGTNFASIKAGSALSGLYLIGNEGGDTGQAYVLCGADGATTLGTYDGFGDAAHITIQSDGDTILDSSNNIELNADNGIVAIKDASVTNGYFKGSSLFLAEQADAYGDAAAYGQLWVDTATPNELAFTDDAGTDIIGIGKYHYETKMIGYYGGTIAYLPITGYVLDKTSTTNNNEFIAFVAPYNGTIEKVGFRSEAAMSGTMSFRLIESADGTEVPGSSVFRQDTGGVSLADDTYYEIPISSPGTGTAYAPMTKGRIYALLIVTPASSFDTNVTVVFKWDTTS